MWTKWSSELITDITNSASSHYEWHLQNVPTKVHHCLLPRHTNLQQVFWWTFASLGTNIPRHTNLQQDAMAAPFTHLLTKEHLEWSKEAQFAFQQLKVAVNTLPVLLLSDFSSPFMVETGALGKGMGAILSQDDHPIAFFNKPLCIKLLHASTYVQELYAIIIAIKKWR